MRVIGGAAALAILLVLGCVKDPGDEPTSKEQEKPAEPTTLPITTSSAEARRRFQKGLAFADDRRNREAIEEFKTALALDPNFALAHAFLGTLTPGAEGSAALARAVQLAEKLPEVEALYIEYLRAKHEGQDAKVYAARIDLARRLPGDWRAQMELGDQYYEEEKWDLAVEAYRKAVALNPSSSAYNPLGYALAMQDKLPEAVEVMRRYVKVRPNDPNPLDSLGEIELMAGNLDEAEQAFLRANAASGEYWEAWHGVAQARLLRGDDSGATEAFEKARAAATLLGDRLQLDVAEVWALLAEDKVEAAFAKIDSLERQAKAGKDEYGWVYAPLLRATVQIELGRPAESLPGLSVALDRALKSKLPGIYAQALRRRVLLRQVIAYSDLGKAKDAETALGPLLEEAKKSAVETELRVALHIARAMVWKARGEIPAAIGELKRCDARAAYIYTYDIRPENAACLLRLMRIQKQARDHAAARATGEKILRSYVRDPVYVFVRSRVGTKDVASR